MTIKQTEAMDNSQLAQFQNLLLHQSNMRQQGTSAVVSVISVLAVLIGCIVFSAFAAYQYGYLEAESQNTGPDSSPIVWIARTGDSYHRKNCIKIKKSKLIQTSIREASNAGYTSCEECNPNKLLRTSSNADRAISFNVTSTWVSSSDINTVNGKASGSMNREKLLESLKASGYIPQRERTYVLPPIYGGDEPVEVSYDAYKYIKDAETNEDIIEGFQSYLSANDRYSGMKSYKKHDEEEMRKVTSYIEKFKQKYGDRQKDIVAIEISSK